MKNLFLLMIGFFLVSCEMDHNESIVTESQNIGDLEGWIEKISEKKIYFGHQSVGYNIIVGIDNVLNEDQKRKLKILDSQNIDEYKGNMIAHSRIGYNSDPSSKIFGFSNYMDNLSSWSPDVAMFKYCYVDLSKKTHIERLFSEYKNRMDKLKAKYPDTTFVHVTVPLTTIQSGFKAELKKLLGKPIAGIEANIVRNKYNELIRKTYSSKDPVFDLAEIESTLPDGSRSKFEVGGTTYYSLSEAYTTDGGHLNSTGRKIVAVKLLEFLAGIEGK